MKEFEFPTNIKQIGSIGEGLRIYIEDYAYSYLQQYIDTPGYETKLAFLVGRAMVIDSQNVLFISGVVRGQHTETERGMPAFTNKSFDHARKEIDRYFGGLEIVGWMQSQPGFGLRLSPSAAEYHMKTFPDKSNVCMVMDNDEKMNAFYIQGADSGDGRKLMETKGYFIYYDKNRGMHEYMLDNKAAKIRVISAEGKGSRDDDHETDNDHENIPSGEVAVQRIRRNYSMRNGPDTKVSAKDASPRKVTSFERDPDTPQHTTKDTIKTSLGLGKNRGSTPRSFPMPSQRRVVNLLMSFCAVLLVVSLVMGAGMLQNIERIDILERQLTDLTTSHRSLLTEFTNAARPVFADNISGEATQSTPPAQQPPRDTTSAAAVPPQSEAAQTTAQEALIGTSSPSQSPINIEALISQLQESATPPEPYQPTAAAPPTEAAQPPSPPPAPEPTTQLGEALLPEIPPHHVVESGDTLSYISRLFYGTVERVPEIMELNNITDPNSIRAGDIIRLPRR